ncbi:serine proteinase stubble isoform X3 [Achroia grisella]|uniref:serine proteinase stubble isoform X3 n=1 Tax=Achroia grisella TaxID=688607 RepID=UPI0027D2F193|nr:serine proteinase stubble isoform X3 [Achroia grisella]
MQCGLKVFLLIATCVVVGDASNALSVYRNPYKNIMFIPKNVYRNRARQSRVLFLDEDENQQPFGKGEIDLTLDKNSNSKFKFDETDYEFTSPDSGTDSPIKPPENLPSGNERFYEPLPRFRPFSYPKYYNGRFSRPYAPNFGFEYQPFAPAVRTSYYPVNGWKARSPRVVFPYQETGNSVQTNAHGGGFDNVVFREQNFGLNDADEQLQDIGTGDADAFAERGCGIAVSKQTAQRRIVGGDDAGFGTFPWQAYIRIGSSRCNMLMSIFELIGWKQCWIERCGGSLISRRHVVTAGHCVARAQPRHVRVTLGDYVINSAAEPLPAYTFGVRSIKVHPLFKFTPQADRFDVAVLTLDRNVHYMPHIAPICLPERGSDFLGQYGWAAGWGALSPGSRLRPRTLQAVDVPVLDNRVCERWHRANGINVVIYPEMLCAGYRGGGKDSCQGDSGGPLMLERAGRWYLIGVVSAGYSCASRGQPGIYHRVAHTVDWISHATTLS